MKSTINLDISNQIATFTFNRPKQFNAITAAGPSHNVEGGYGD